MWSDNEATIDLLNVDHLVGAVLRVVKDDRLDPVTVGVYGDWGSGKSSVIQMLRQRIGEDPDLLAVYFNGWRFEGYEDAKAALASTILEQIQEEAEREAGKLTKVKDAVISTVKGFWGRIDKLRLGKQALALGANAAIAGGAVVLGATAAVPITTALITTAVLRSLLDAGKDINGENLAELIKEREKAEAQEQRDKHASVRDFNKEFAKLISQLGIKRLVVIVDDLDRCLPLNVIDVLEAIRLFLSVPHTAFVIAADEALIRESVGYRFQEPASASTDGRPRATVSARYLEKLIQVPIRVPPLSPSDLHGYLNLLFAQDRETEQSTFAALCARVRSASTYDSVSFHAGNAAELLGHAVSDGLRSDFLLAEQVAPVLALSAEGNPRQTKRFLNALVLRLQMAADRNVKLDRAVAAKVLLLEYFMPELFRTLALEAAENGRSSALSAVEKAARDGGDSTGSESRSPTGGGPFAAQAGTLSANVRFQTWLRVDPPLGTVDLRPYIYFARERYALPVSLAQRLSPAGSRALSHLLGDSEAEQNAAADVTATLPLPEVTVIVSELTTRARTSGVDLQARTSPLHAFVLIAQKRPEVGSDVIASVLGIPYETLPPTAAVLLASLAHVGDLRKAVETALEQFASQSTNPGLQTAAKARLENIRVRPAPAQRR